MDATDADGAVPTEQTSKLGDTDTKPDKDPEPVTKFL